MIVDPQTKLDEVVALVEAARTMPMSSSCVVNRQELLAGLDELRELLATVMSATADDRPARRGRREAEGAAPGGDEQLIGNGLAEHAAREADRIIGTAREEAQRLRLEVDDYVETKLANFEVVLHKTLAAVQRGRARLHGELDMADLAARPRHQSVNLPGVDRALPG